MKVTIHIWIAASCLVGISQRSAQDEKSDSPEKQWGTKVGVVNAKVFFEKYWRAKSLRRDLEHDLAPFQKKIDALQDQIKLVEKDLREPSLSPDTAHRKQQTIKAHRRSIEDLQLEARSLFAKRQDENLAVVWKELKMGATFAAQAYGFQIVLSYGEPDTISLLSVPPKSPRMNLGPAGEVAPPNIPGAIDFTDIVVSALKPLCNEDMKKRAYPTVEKERK